jgi:hypothetical protein
LIVFSLVFQGFAIQPAPAAQVVNVKYIHDYIYKVHGVTVPINASNPLQIANVKYLLCAVDKANSICGWMTTDYCNHTLATQQAVDTVATIDAVNRLVQCPVIPYNTDGLVACLDTIYPVAVGESVWKDLTINGNDFALTNATLTSDGVDFVKAGGYAKSVNVFGMSAWDAVTIEIRFKALPPYGQSLLFEYTSNWNSQVGGFGAALNEVNSAYTPNMIHTNQMINASTRVAVNYSDQVTIEDAEFHTATMTVSSVPNPTGRLFYYDGGLVNCTIGAINCSADKTEAYGTFVNDYFFVNTRNGTGSFAHLVVQSVRIYRRQLTAAQVCANARLDYQIHGGTPPNC